MSMFLGDRPASQHAVVVEQLRRLGVREGGVLIVHSSFRVLRPIEGGPLGLIAALQEALGRLGTLVMPSWTGDDDEVFDPASTPVATALGSPICSGVRRACDATATLRHSLPPDHKRTGSARQV